ncbi:hypothetical protein FJ872_31985 [Mesorhizobium sp. B2-5-9]|uniref:hypothetical protein n=1 Tax=Mesorhizobium sp. B2-5-9 TaxID=2589921 RepID=UPI00112AC1D9|nr:hypothetical protein [Mesorhizobium sp. B2-5-9]TPJ97635.1 hypothetical protein FJ872_31985 [Mesorhizobium sp. B2-5-9]
MPFNAQGVFSLPPGVKAVSNEIASSSAYNTALVDIEAAFNAKTPVTRGGSNADNGVDAAKNLGLISAADLAGTGIVTGSATEIILTTSRGYSTLANSIRIALRAASASADDGTTFTLDDCPEANIKKIVDGAYVDIEADDWFAGSIIELRYDTLADSGDGAFVLLMAPPKSRTGIAILTKSYAYNASDVAATENAWTIFPLDTETSDADGIVSISTNSFTPTEDCIATWSASMYISTGNTASDGGGTFVTQIYNVTDSAIVGVNGSLATIDLSWVTNPPADPDPIIRVVNRLTSQGMAVLAAGKAYEIRYYAVTSGSGDGVSIHNPTSLVSGMGNDVALRILLQTI